MHGLFVRRVYSGLAAAGGWREPNARIVKIPMSSGRRTTDRHHKPWTVDEVTARAFCRNEPPVFLNLQTLYELRLAEKKSGKAIKKLPTLKHLEQVSA